MGMTRRLGACGALLVGAACLLMLLASQRLAGSPSFERASAGPGAGAAAGAGGEHGRAQPPQLQQPHNHTGWMNNDLDSEEASGPAGSGNHSRSIQEVVSEQRQLIAEEMAGYTYPDGRYNVSAKSLADLVPELGGRPVRNVVITTWRSGSTFLGDVLNSHPANFYHYEPLLDYEIVQIRGEPLAGGAVSKLRALLNCNYTGLDHYLTYGQDHVWLFNHNARLWTQCQQHPHLCWLPNFLSPFCQLFPFQSMKVVRLRLRLVEGLLDDPSLNIRLLLLVRDPRGTLQSRKHREWCPGNPDCSEPSRLCDDLVEDYSAAVLLHAKYPHRFRVVRYEDLSVEPYQGVQELFEFFGLDFHPNVQQFLDTHTKVDVGGVSSTYRNSKSAPFHWRQDLSHQEVRDIQKACASAMEQWGYKVAANSSHQKEFNPLTTFTLT